MDSGRTESRFSRKASDLTNQQRGRTPILESVIPAISPQDPQVGHRARSYLAGLAKPVDSLGRIEGIAVRLASISGHVPGPILNRPALAVFAADHGVVVESLSNWSHEATAHAIDHFETGSASVSVLARSLGFTLTVVDVGVDGDMSRVRSVVHRKIANGTNNMVEGPAMSQADAEAAFSVGMEVANRLLDTGHNLLAVGDLGVGNSTSASAVLCALTTARPSLATGRGSGIDDAEYSRKVATVRSSLDRFRSAHGDDCEPWTVLRELGGFETAALAGFMIAAAARSVPIVVDGLVTLTAALVADRLASNLRHHLIAGHRSTEPGSTIILDHLDIDPILELDLRLGEGSGAAMAIPIVQAAAALMHDMSPELAV